MKLTISKSPKHKACIVFFDQQQILAPKHWLEQNKALVQWVKAYLQAAKPQQPVVQKLFSPDCQPLLLVGLPKKGTAYLGVGGMVGKALLKAVASSMDLILPANSHPLTKNCQVFFEGMLLGHYEFRTYMSAPKETPKEQPVKHCTIITDVENCKTALDQAQILAGATNAARDWANSPGNHFTPTNFKTLSAEIAKEVGLKFSCLDEKQMIKEKMGCFEGVFRGSEEPAFLNILEYSGAASSKDCLLLVGKGLTFDSGGYSIKPSPKMEEMKFDMCGGAAVLAAMKAIGQLKPKVNVVGLIAATENLVSGCAYKPGDILTACNGKTVEVLNTDAEGRLILADTLAYGIKRFNPTATINLATLTGAILVALGHQYSGLMSNNEPLQKLVQESGKRTEDKVWPLPMDEAYGKLLKGDYADLVNVTSGYEGGSITAGKFLEHFVDKKPWVHLDIAGMSNDIKKVGHVPATGASGYGVRLLVDLVQNWPEGVSLG